MKHIAIDENLIKRPPWSGQKVRAWVRVLAWVWTLLVVSIAPVLLWLAFNESIPLENLVEVALMVLLEIYMTLLFAHVAVRGRAPTGWFPWDPGTKRSP